MKKLLALMLIIPTLSFALGTSTYQVNFGAYTPFVGKFQGSEDGSTDKFQLNPYISISQAMNSWGDIMIQPELSFAYHLETENYTKYDIMTLFPVVTEVGQALMFRYGFGVIHQYLKGDGETVNMPNGNDTLDFYQAGESVTTHNTILLVGLEAPLGNNQSVRLDTFVFNFLDPGEKMSFSYTLTGGMSF